MMRYRAVATALLSLVIALPACNDATGPAGADERDALVDARGGRGRALQSDGILTITPPTSLLAIGAHTELKVERVPGKRPGKTFRPVVRWSSSDERVATVSRRGVVTARATGSATITATSRKHGVGTAAVTVHSRKPTPPPPPPPANLAPEAHADSVTFQEDSAIVLQLRATDPDGDPLEITLGDANHGIAEALDETQCDDAVPSNCTLDVRFVPAANFHGIDSLPFTVSDDSLSSAAVVAMTVTSVNDAPVAVPDTVRIGAVSTVVIDALANDLDADGDSLRLVSVQDISSFLTTVGIENGRITFTTQSTNTFFSFTYVVSDGTVESTGQIEIRRSNKSPTPRADTINAVHDRTTLLDVVANDTDPDGDALTLLPFNIGLAAPNQGGTVTVVDGKVRYTPRAGFTGTESFDYLISDGLAAAKARATVIVTNVAPDAAEDTLTLDRRVANVTLDVLANDVDGDGDSLRITAVGSTSHGGQVTTNGRTISYTPSGFAPVEERFTYTTTDGAAQTLGEVTIRVRDIVADSVAAMVQRGDSVTTIAQALRTRFALAHGDAFALMRAAMSVDDRLTLAAVCHAWGLDEDPQQFQANVVPGRQCVALARSAGMSAQFAGAALALAFDMNARSTGIALMVNGYTQAEIMSAWRDVFLMGPGQSAQIARTSGIGGVSGETMMRSLQSAYGIDDAVEMGRLVHTNLSDVEWVPALQRIYGINQPSALRDVLLQTPLRAKAIGYHLKRIGTSLDDAMTLATPLGTADRFWFVNWHFGNMTDAVVAMRQRWNTPATDIGPVLYQEWRRNTTTIESALLNANAVLASAGYTSSEIAAALPMMTGAGITPQAMASMLRGARFQASEVGVVLKDHYQTSATDAAGILKNVGYAAQDVGNALTEVWTLSTPEVARTLQQVQYGIEATGQWLTTTAVAAEQYSTDWLAGALETAGYAATTVWWYIETTAVNLPNSFLTLMKGVGCFLGFGGCA